MLLSELTRVPLSPRANPSGARDRHNARLSLRSHHHCPVSRTMMEPTTKPTHPPKDDPITAEELAQFNGSDASKPVYVCIKGAYQAESSRDSRGRHVLGQRQLTLPLRRASL